MNNLRLFQHEKKKRKGLEGIRGDPAVGEWEAGPSGLDNIIMTSSLIPEFTHGGQ